MGDDIVDDWEAQSVSGDEDDNVVVLDSDDDVADLTRRLKRATDAAGENSLLGAGGGCDQSRCAELSRQAGRLRWPLA